MLNGNQTRRSRAPTRVFFANRRLGPAPHVFWRLPPTTRSRRANGVACAAFLLWGSACERSKNEATDPRAAASEVSVTEATTSATAAASSTSEVTHEGVASWAVGGWQGTGVAEAVKLTLPGNQGVQLAWVQDKGTSFVGPVELALELGRDGRIKGRVSGRLGELLLNGDWDGGERVYADLAPAKVAPDAFSGLLSLELQASSKTATASLRVVSHDGRWVRNASAQLAPGR